MTITAANQTIAGVYDSTAGTVLPLALNLVITASRTSGVSPCTIIFSADSSSSNGLDEHDVWLETGFYWDFDDPTSGNFTTGDLSSRNISVGGPMAAHTFVVADGDGSQTFVVKCNAVGPNGESRGADFSVTVQAQLGVGGYYAAADIIAVSDSLDPATESEWTDVGFDRAIPAGTVEAQRRNAMPAWNEMSGKLIMIHRGSDFQSSVTQIKYGSENIVITDFGNDLDARAIVGGFHIGTQGDSPYDVKATDNDYAGYGGVWINNVTIEKLKSGRLAMGMTYQHIGFHDIDMNWSGSTFASPTGATTEVGVRGSRGASNCLESSNNLTPANVPFIKGLYLSDMDMVGADDWYVDGATNGVDGAASLFFPGLHSYSCVIGCTINKSSEHNIRIQGVYRSMVGYCNLEGNARLSGKHNITHRGTGYNDLGDIDGLTWDLIASAPGFIDADIATLEERQAQNPRTRWYVQQNNNMGAGSDPNGASYSSEAAIEPVASTSLMLLEDGIIRGNTFIAGTHSAGSNVRIAGRWITVQENTRFAGINAGVTGEAMNDIIPLTPMYPDTQPDIPVPTAPR